MANSPFSLKQYFLSDFFDAERGKRLTKSDRIPGDIPLVTAGFQNEGIAEYINNEQEVFSNAITIDMFGNSFWRPYKFSCDDNIIVLKHSALDDTTAYFFLLSIKITTGDYNYSHQYRLKDLKKHVIRIPEKNDGTIDLEFIRHTSSVLKSLSSTTSELTATLLSELEYRTKQFDY